MCVLAALMVASTAISAIGAIQQGQQAEEMARAQKAAYDREAEATMRASSLEAAREFENGRRAEQRALVSVAGSGVGLAGSASEVLSENARQNAMDMEIIGYNARAKASTLRTQGDLALFRGQQARSASFLNAAGEVVSGTTKLFDPRNKFVLGGNMFASSSPFAGMY